MAFAASVPVLVTANIIGIVAASKRKALSTAVGVGTVACCPSRFSRGCLQRIPSGYLASCARQSRPKIRSQQQLSQISLMPRNRRNPGWFIRNVTERVDQVLSWLPVDAESFWVNREGFIVNAKIQLELLWDRPALSYSTQRLRAQNGGEFYRALHNRRVPLVIAAARNIGDSKDGIPGAIPADVVYFYFFTEPVDLPSPDEVVYGKPVWRGTATILVSQMVPPGTEPQYHEDQNWLGARTPRLACPYKQSGTVE